MKLWDSCGKGMLQKDWGKSIIKNRLSYACYQAMSSRTLTCFLSQNYAISCYFMYVKRCMWVLLTGNNHIKWWDLNFRVRSELITTCIFLFLFPILGLTPDLAHTRLVLYYYTHVLFETKVLLNWPEWSSTCHPLALAPQECWNYRCALYLTCLLSCYTRDWSWGCSISAPSPSLAVLEPFALTSVMKPMWMYHLVQKWATSQPFQTLETQNVNSTFTQEANMTLY